MSRQSKNARNMERARKMSALRKEGKKGPARTAPKHGKSCGYRTNPEVQKRARAAQQAGERTSGKSVLRAAGGASRK